MQKEIFLFLLSTTIVLSGCGKSLEGNGVETEIQTVELQPPEKQEASMPETEINMDGTEENREEGTDGAEAQTTPEEAEAMDEWEEIEYTEADYQIITETYEQGEIKLRYPQITGYEDEKKQEEINTMIRDDLMKTQVDEVLESIENDYLEIIPHLNLDYEITMQTAEILSILYTGNYQETNEFYSDPYWFIVDALTIDMRNGRRLEITDFVDVDEELVKRIKECRDYTNEIIRNEQDKEDLSIVIQEARSDFIIEGLLDGHGEYQFCVTPDALKVSIGTVHVGGDYIIFTLKNDSPTRIRRQEEKGEK